MSLKKLILPFLGLLVLASCSTPKKITYFQDLGDGDAVDIIRQADIVVKPEDKLSILVNSKDPKLAALFNLPTVNYRIQSTTEGGAQMGGNSQISLYTVNPFGDIDFPVLGEIHIAGMRRYEVAEYIKNRLVSENLVKDPVVTVEFENHGISVLGEVNNPGRVMVNRDRINVLEAIAMSGDLTINGRRENVLVLREVDGKEQAYRLDLTNTSELVKSPGFYLQPNDIVYVDPNNFKKRQTTVNGNTALSASFWVSLASLAVSIAVLIVK